MIARGRLASISATGMVEGTISLYTRASRTRRAMSWAYCAPKSTTRTVSLTAGVADDTGGLPAIAARGSGPSLPVARGPHGSPVDNRPQWASAATDPGTRPRQTACARPVEVVHTGRQADVHLRV